MAGALTISGRDEETALSRTRKRRQVSSQRHITHERQPGGVTAVARSGFERSFCIQIENDWFTAFGTRSSKVRLSSLDLLRAGCNDYVLTDAPYDFMGNQDLTVATVARLIAEPAARCSDQGDIMISIVAHRRRFAA